MRSPERFRDGSLLLQLDEVSPEDLSVPPALHLQSVPALSDRFDERSSGEQDRNKGGLCASWFRLSLAWAPRPDLWVLGVGAVMCSIDFF